MKIIIGLLLILCASVFGQNVEPHFDLPIDADRYIVRPGDELTVTFLRANIESLKLTVDPEGRIIHTNLGLFDLSNRTLAESKEILRAAIKNLYKVENVVISITGPQKVSFSVTGAVKYPGFYQGYTSQRVSDAIKLAGGILPGGSSRQILFSGGPEDIIVDLDLARFNGDLNFDPCLYSGQKVYVPQKTNSRVQTIGEVNYPREIELLPGDDLKLLISLAGGYRGWADSNNVQIIRNGDIVKAAGQKIVCGDIIKVIPLADVAEFNKVSIFGAVQKTGAFDAKKITTLGELLNSSGGYDTRAVKERITVFRFSPSDASGRLTTERFPIQNIDGDPAAKNSFMLSPGDSVFVPFSVGTVVVTGLVLNPGTFPFQSNKSADHYIGMAGGFLPEADRTQIGLYDSISHITTKLSPKVTVHDGSRIIVEMRKEFQ